MLLNLRSTPFATVILLAAFVVSPAAEPPMAPPPHAALPTGIDPKLADWTPRPATGKAEPWEKATDKDWIDPRFREMDTGQFLGCTLSYPLEKNSALAFKALTLKLGEHGDAGAVFDRSTMRMNAAWTGAFLQHSARRFGLLNTPTPKGDILFASPPGPGWANPEGKEVAEFNPFTKPLPSEWVKYQGVFTSGNRTVLKYTVGKTEILDSPTMEIIAGVSCLIRTIRISPIEKSIKLIIGDYRESFPDKIRTAEVQIRQWGHEIVGVKGDTQAAFLQYDREGKLWVNLPPVKEPQLFRLLRAKSSKDDEKLIEAIKNLPAPVDPLTLTKGGPKRWGEPIVAKLELGSDTGPFAIDTLTIPYKNPFGALFFCTGLDFLPDGRIAVCTCHGDVWLVTVNEKAGTCSWQRFATGLYQPLGLKVVDGKIIVLERGQLTRLHDLNNDGEADYYECINNDWHTGAGEHSYDTCLETDPQGNFYFFKTGDTDLLTGGCLMRVSADGKKAEVFATGFRHPIGLGMSPSGILTGADQEGNWMPATRIDEYKRGGFYGDMRAHHRDIAPKIYDPPLCWLPREVDNSAGGQVWAPAGSFGPLAGLPLHFSYGRCKIFVLLRQQTADGIVQGGAVDLGITFLSGVCRGRFNPADGLLYVCGLNGWQTAAQADGCLQRVRLTGKPLDVPVALSIEGDAVRLTFSNPLDIASATKTNNYRAAWWNYHWTGEYGSKRWKVSDPTVEGQDEFQPGTARLLADGRTVELQFDKLQAVMQMQVGYNLTSATEKKVSGSVFLTINATK